MNVVITTFVNPFSFFCIRKEDGKDIDFLQNLSEPANNFKNNLNKITLSDVTHGQYIAVLWKNKWTRGLVTMETQFLIWLIDYGINLRPNDNTVYKMLPTEHKKYPTKVFEASIHGVVPVDKALNENCQIQNMVSHIWNAGSIEKAQYLISNANRVLFVPVALMSTKHNDVVLGDLYLQYGERSIVNIIDELELWPVFLEKNKQAYIKNLSTVYTSRRKHRGCVLKPAIADDLPTMTCEIPYTEYCAICDAAPQLEVQEYHSGSEGGSTVLEYGGKSKDSNIYKLTTKEIEKYSNKYMKIYGCKYNVLNLLTNKMRDLKICAMYKDHDLKSVGRATIRSRRPCQSNK